MLLVGGGHRPGCRIRRLVQRVPRMPLHPREAHLPAPQLRIQLAHQIRVQHRLAVTLFPAALLPARHPLRQRIDDVLGIAQNVQLLAGAVLGGQQQVQHGHQLALVVGALWPAARMPAGLVDEPGPAGGAGVTQGGAVCCCGNSHGSHFGILGDSSVAAASPRALTRTLRAYSGLECVLPSYCAFPLALRWTSIILELRYR